MATFGGSVAHPDYCIWVIAVFMFIFSINFNLFFLIITGKALTAIFSEELRWFVGVVLAATGFITVNLMMTEKYADFGETLKHAFFQVSTVISTTGFATDDFNLWSGSAKAVLLVLMFIGACAGSTGGGIKISRIVIAFKSTWSEIRHMIHPRRVKKIFFEKKSVDNDTVRGVFAYMVAYVLIFFASFLVVAICDGMDIESTFSAVAACINNIGPGFGEVGPAGNFAGLTAISKIVLVLDMLLGRLEIFPILLLFYPTVWKEK